MQRTLIVVCSALFLQIVSAHSSEVVGAAGTYQQEVDTLNLTSMLPRPLQIMVSACCVYTLTAVAALGFMINCWLQNYLTDNSAAETSIRRPLRLCVIV